MGAQVLLRRLLRDAPVEVGTRHAPADRAGATQHHGGNHHEHVVGKGQEVLHPVEQGHFHHGNHGGRRRAARVGENLREPRLDGRHLDPLEAPRVGGRVERAHGQPMPVELARLGVDQVVAELRRNLIEHLAAGSHDVARNLVEVAEPRAAPGQQPGHRRLAGGDATREKDRAHGLGPPVEAGVALGARDAHLALSPRDAHALPARGAREVLVPPRLASGGHRVREPGQHGAKAA